MASLVKAPARLNSIYLSRGPRGEEKPASLASRQSIITIGSLLIITILKQLQNCCCCCYYFRFSLSRLVVLFIKTPGDSRILGIFICTSECHWSHSPPGRQIPNRVSDSRVFFFFVQQARPRIDDDACSPTISFFFLSFFQFLYASRQASRKRRKPQGGKTIPFWLSAYRLSSSTYGALFRLAGFAGLCVCVCIQTNYCTAW